MPEKLRVLIVDDDRRMVKTISDILTIKGYGTGVAYSGEEMLKSVRSTQWDCVLMDLKMPGMDGVATLRKLKELAPDLPVVLMSAFAMDEQVEEARRLGAYSVLTKPFDIEMLLSFLSHLRKKISVLIVDEDPHFCQTLREIMESRGYRVETEADPDLVLEHMEEDYKLLVILDTKLSATGGEDVIGRIRAKYPAKPVVLVTSHKDRLFDSIDRAYRASAYTYLYKPLESDALLDIVEEIRWKKLRVVLGEPFEPRAEAAATEVGKSPEVPSQNATAAPAPQNCNSSRRQ